MLKMYISMLVGFLAIDSLWLMVVARKFYQEQLGHLMGEKVNLAAAGAFYLLGALGMLLLVVVPHQSKGLLTTMMMGGLLGLVSYGAYDLTNWATLKGWTLVMTLVDMGWGCLLCSLVAGIGWWVGKS